MGLPRKTTILIIILAIITSVLIFLAVTSETTQQLITDAPQQIAPTETIVEPYATLSFSSPVLDLTNSQTATHSVDVVLDTNGKGASGVQIELQYDPNVLYNVKVQNPAQNSLFGSNVSVLISDVNQAQGRISYAVALTPSEEEKIGRGTVATIVFSSNTFSILPRTEIAFLPKSAVGANAGSNSVLKNSMPLSIILFSPTITPIGSVTTPVTPSATQ